MRVIPIDAAKAMPIIVAHHYLHRRCNVLFAFALLTEKGICGVVTFGKPASYEVCKGACPSNPAHVLELNRLWVADDAPHLGGDSHASNVESWFVSRALALLPPRMVVSYADTVQGHTGVIYRALGFHYAGWTDMERRTPRFDYVPPSIEERDLFGGTIKTPHSRDAFRSGAMAHGVRRERRKPKVKYWTVTGNRREKRQLRAAAGWPVLCYRSTPPPIGAAQ